MEKHLISMRSNCCGVSIREMAEEITSKLCGKCTENS
jgi:hypothetical protein